jgi:hypothetical protein
VFSESGQATIEASPGEWLKATAGPELQTNWIGETNFRTPFV